MHNKHQKFFLIKLKIFDTSEKSQATCDHHAVPDFRTIFLYTRMFPSLLVLILLIFHLSHMTQMMIHIV